MITINLNEGGHVWEKQNLVTIFNGRKHYDIYKCKNCGIEGKTNSLITISLKESLSSENIFNCKGKIHKDLPTRIKITNCTAAGPQFQNLTQNSEHDVVTPPNGYKNDYTGLWVMGIGEPVKVLPSEFIPL